jgi:CBS domain-containing protein
MREHGVRRLPVTDEEGYLAGIVALDDLLDNYAMQLGTLAQALHSERSHEERFRT